MMSCMSSSIERLTSRALVGLLLILMAADACFFICLLWRAHELGSLFREAVNAMPVSKAEQHHDLFLIVTDRPSAFVFCGGDGISALRRGKLVNVVETALIGI